MPEDRNNFLQSMMKGETGQRFVLKHLDSLICDTVVQVADTSKEKISGKDCVATVVRRDMGDEVEKYVEVKTVWNYLTRTNDDEEPTGTLGFELWNKETRKTRGWLDKLLHPEKHKKAVRPDIFVFLLVAYENIFAAIVFEQIPDLIERLYDLAFKAGVDLNAIPCGPEAEEWQPHIGKIVKNMWLLPFSLFKDLATVTLIGKKPRVRPDIISGPGGTRLCTASIQEKRYDQLVLSSGDRPHMDADEEFCRAFVGDEADHFFAIIDHDLDVLENTDFDTCFSYLARYNRSKGQVLDCLQGILLCMLAHENPSRESEGKRYVPLSYEWLKNWCEQNGQKRQIITWFRNIKLTIMFELLEYYRPSITSPNPIDQMVNAFNESPYSVGYYAPVELTREKLLYADYYAGQQSL